MYQVRNILRISTFRKFKTRYLSVSCVFLSYGISQIIKEQRKLRGLDFHDFQEQTNPYKEQLQEQNIQNLLQTKQNSSFQFRILNNIFLTIRFLQVIMYFIPVAILTPFYYFFPMTFEDILLNQIVLSIEWSGSVYVKLAQYISHRPDIVNDKTIQKFKHLRQATPMHSFEETMQILEKNNFSDQVENIDKNCVASGVIGQVYKCKLKDHDQTMILKVRHPKIFEKLQQDLKIIFSVTSMLKTLPGFGWTEIPVSMDEFVKVLVDQTDFRIEGENLNKFQTNFQNLKSSMLFPKGYFSSEEILVQQYIDQSQDLGQYILTGDKRTKSLLAKTGVNGFYRMIIYDNFVHADCHAGNFLVQKVKTTEDIQQTPFQKQFLQFKNWVFENFSSFQYSILKLYMEYNKENIDEKSSNEEYLQNSFDKLKSDYADIMIEKASEILLKEDEQFKLVCIDTGMVSQLKPNDHKNILKLLKSICSRDIKECCIYMRMLSQVEDKDGKIDPTWLKNILLFEEDIKPIFTKINSQDLDKINLGEVVQNIITNAQKRHIKFEGNVACLLSNIIVLEGLARQLDENINIIGQAIPFFMNPKVAQMLLS